MCLALSQSCLFFLDLSFISCKTKGLVTSVVFKLCSRDPGRCPRGWEGQSWGWKMGPWTPLPTWHRMKLLWLPSMYSNVYERPPVSRPTMTSTLPNPMVTPRASANGTSLQNWKYLITPSSMQHPLLGFRLSCSCSFSVSSAKTSSSPALDLSP